MNSVTQICGASSQNGRPTVQSASHRRRLWALIAIISLAGCRDGSPVLTRRSIDPVRGGWGLVGRSVLRCPAGDCIILHFPPSERLLEQNVVEADLPLDAIVRLVLAEDDSDSANDGMIVTVPDRWGGERANEITLATFNCASYAFGQILDLHEGDWIDTKIRAETNDTAPFDVVLDSYFRETMRGQRDDVDWDELASSAAMRDNDLFCLMRQHENRPECLHVGRIRKRRDENWLESKIGRGPIVLASLEATAAAYDDTYDLVVIFREK